MIFALIDQVLDSVCVSAVAQSVEQRIRNAKVTSSIPVSGTNRNKHLGQSSGVALFVCAPSMGALLRVESGGQGLNGSGRVVLDDV